MRLLVATDAHIYRTPDGAAYCSTLYGYDYFCRYRMAFDQVRVVAREKAVPAAEAGWLRVDGPGVSVFGIPFFQGPKQLLPKYLSIHRRLRGAAEDCDAAMLRVPGQTAHMTFSHLPKGLPVGAEVVSDFTGFLQNTDEGLIQTTLYRLMSRTLARICRRANGVCYVTREAIQKHYPSQAMLHGASESYFDCACSDIELSDGDFGAPRDFAGQTRFTLILTNAAMNSERKGERVLLAALERLRGRGFDVRGVFVGDGALRAAFEREAAERGLSDAVRFTGLLPSRTQVMAELRAADIYVLPTQAEGLPRGVIEAMAAGLPCLSTPVGGMPELLEADCLVADPKDVEGFAGTLSAWLSEPQILERKSRENLAHAQAFRHDLLSQRRTEFYQKLAALAKRRRNPE